MELKGGESESQRICYGFVETDFGKGCFAKLNWEFWEFKLGITAEQ